jgi:type IV fimbrial biogenesis protein FimT
MKNVAGFTWIDILTTLTVTIILATVGLITYHDFLLRNAISQTTNQLANAMLYARSQAVLHDEKIVLCGSATQRVCDGDWTSGQLVFYHDTVLRVMPAISPRVRLMWVSSLNKRATLDFAADGSTAGQQGHFELYTVKGRLLAKLIVTHSGRLRAEEG